MGTCKSTNQNKRSYKQFEHVWTDLGKRQEWNSLEIWNA